MHDSQILLKDEEKHYVQSLCAILVSLCFIVCAFFKQQYMLVSHRFLTLKGMSDIIT